MINVYAIYESTKIGNLATLKAEGADRENLEKFKKALVKLNILKTNGLVEITYEHSESQVNRYIDYVKFKRLE